MLNDRFIGCKFFIDNDSIKNAENLLKIKFPRGYFDYLGGCDGGMPLKSDFQYYDEDKNKIKWAGIGSFLAINNDKKFNFVIRNLHPPEFFPEGLIAFAETGGGDYICFDYRGGKDNPDPPIVYWSHEADIGKDVSFIAGNFEEFVGMLREPQYTG